MLADAAARMRRPGSRRRGRRLHPRRAQGPRRPVSASAPNEPETAASPTERPGRPPRPSPLFEKAGLTFKSGRGGGGGGGDRDARHLAAAARARATRRESPPPPRSSPALFLESGRAPLRSTGCSGRSQGQPVLHPRTSTSTTGWPSPRRRTTPRKRRPRARRSAAEHLGFEDVDDRRPRWKRGKPIAVVACR